MREGQKKVLKEALRRPRKRQGWPPGNALILLAALALAVALTYALRSLLA